MRIALDCRALCSAITGGGQYTYHLINELARLDGNNEYFLCSPRDIALPHNADKAQNIEVRINRYPLGIMWQQIGLPAILRDLKIDLFHSPLGTLPIFSITPSVITILDLTTILMPQTHSWKMRLSVNSLIRSAARKARRIIAISDHTKKDIVEHLNIREDKVTSIPLGVDPRFKPLEACDGRMDSIRQKYSRGEEYILYMGTLEPRKNLVFLLQVYEKLVNREPCMPKLVLAGGKGWKYSPIFRLINSVDTLKKNVICPGYIPDGDLPYLYSAAELFVYPSLYEGFGLPTLEAMACGTPTITSNSSSLPEVVGEGGITLDPLDASAWDTAIQETLHNLNLRQELKLRGIRQAKKFTWETTARATLELYSQITEQ